MAGVSIPVVILVRMLLVLKESTVIMVIVLAIVTQAILAVVNGLANVTGHALLAEMEFVIVMKIVALATAIVEHVQQIHVKIQQHVIMEVREIVIILAVLDVRVIPNAAIAKAVLMEVVFHNAVLLKLVSVLGGVFGVLPNV